MEVEYKFILFISISFLYLGEDIEAIHFNIKL